MAYGMRLRVDICAVGRVDGEFFLHSGFIWWERGGLGRSFEEGAGEVEMRPSALGLSAFLGVSFEGVFGARNRATKEGGIGFCALPPKCRIFVALIRRWDWGIRPPQFRCDHRRGVCALVFAAKSVGGFDPCD